MMTIYTQSMNSFTQSNTIFTWMIIDYTTHNKLLTPLPTNSTCINKFNIYKIDYQRDKIDY